MGDCFRSHPISAPLIYFTFAQGDFTDLMCFVIRHELSSLGVNLANHYFPGQLVCLFLDNITEALVVGRAS